MRAVPLVRFHKARHTPARMAPRETTTLKHNKVFFVFTDKDSFVFPVQRKEHRHFKQTKGGPVIEDTPYRCDTRTLQEEIIDAVLALMSQKTFLYLEIGPDTEVETVTKLARETHIVLDSVWISDALFFRLMSRTAVEIRNRVTLFDHGNSLDCCLGELAPRIDERIRICFDGYTSEEMERVYENIEKIPKNSIQTRTWKISVAENGISVFLKLWAGFDENSPDIFLESSKREHIEEILEAESQMIWIGRAKNLRLYYYAVSILPKLRIHEENQIEELILDAYDPEHVAEILSMENNSIWVGKVKALMLVYHAVGILHKLRIHRQNEMEELSLRANDPEQITEILKEENNGIWLGKVKNIYLRKYAVEILPKLRIHEENEMDELILDLHWSGQVTEIFKAENNSVWVGKVKKPIEVYAVGILPRLRFHYENVMGELVLDAYRAEYVTEILGMENSSIWVGKIGRLALTKHAVSILPKFRIHGENEMEELGLTAYCPEHIHEMPLMGSNSIWVGKVKALKLEWYALEILPKLAFHKETEMEVLFLNAYSPEYISEIRKTENCSVWIGKVRNVFLYNHTIQILPKLRIHGENGMEELYLCADKEEHIAEILAMENSSVRIGKVKKLGLGGHAVEIEDKLDFTLIDARVPVKRMAVFK
ncbi:MAG: uncharacterized protein A8A55_2178 [Amphiamblys sp. WSBS2006]|nr:MAG: uncharacterized protein A8A55_2178 [Amphiamblys sp. WSBS2006]